MLSDYGSDCWRAHQKGDGGQSENVTLLTEFLVLNECADEFMNVNTEEIERELDAAHDSGKVI